MKAVIKHRTLTVWFCLTVFGFAAAQTPADLAGRWSGAIEIPGSPLEIVVTLTAEDALGGTIDIPAQGAQDVPLENVSTDGQRVSFAIQGVPGVPTFEGQLEEGEIRGTFTQSGQTFPFTLSREETAGVTAAEPAEVGTYKDPQGRFTVPIPTNWTVTEGEGFVTLTDPGGEISVYLSVLEGRNPEAVIARAWQRVDPAFSLEPTDVLTPPSEPGVEKTVVTNYDDSGRIYQGFGQLYNGTVYVFLIDADLAAAQRRGAQINIVATGFKIGALEETDLTGVAPKPVDAAMIAKLETFVTDALPQFGIPGAAVAVVQGGKVVYTGGFGVREAGTDAPLTPDTRMMIGSSGKSLTTMLMATLVDDGRMTWNTPVQDVLPEFEVADPGLSRTMTLRNLVCACTGVPRRDLELFFNAAELTAEGIVESLRTFEFFTDFGEAFQYSNQLVGAGGYAAAAADGADFGELFAGYTKSLRERVLGPIGMTKTTLSFDEVEAAGDAATPHTFALDGLYEPISLGLEHLLLPIAPAGAHWSTTRDMARYLQTELALGVAPDGARVVSERNLRTTWEPQVPVSANTDYGLGWFVGDYRGLQLVYHGGNTLGFTSDLAFLPGKDLGVVVLTNAQATNAFNEAVRERLLELVFDQPARVGETVAFAAEQMSTGLEELDGKLRETDGAAVQSFAGRYRNAALGEVSVGLEGNTLTLDAGEFASELRPIVNDAGKPDGYIFYEAPLAGLPVRFQREAKQPVVVIGEGAVAYTFTRLR